MKPTLQVSADLPADFGARAEYENLIFPLFTLSQAVRAASGDGPIAKRTFRSCVIEGPAVLLALDGVHFDSCHLGVAPENDVRTLLLRPMGARMVTGAIAFENCLFENCVFNGIGYTGPDAFLNHLIDALGDGQGPIR